MMFKKLIIVHFVSFAKTLVRAGWETIKVYSLNFTKHCIHSLDKYRYFKHYLTLRSTFCRLYATSLIFISPLLFILYYYMFRPNRPSWGVQVVAMKESTAYCNAVEIIGCFRYIDNTLVICDERKTNIAKALDKFNEKQPTIKFTIEKEPHNSIHILDF
jgi:hypothetical protein